MMILPLKCLLTGAILFVLFYFCSVPLERLLGWERPLLGERILFGFFAYFLLFEVIAVPLILLQKPFHLLCTVWIAVMAVVVVASLILVFRCGAGRVAILQVSVWDVVFLAAAAAFVILVMALSVFHKYIGWDPSYYLGTMNTTLTTDTMYVFDGADGTKEEVVNLRYALSAFYMQFTFWCRLLGIPVRVMAWWLVRPLCTALSGMIVYRMGMELADYSIRQASSLLILWLGVSLFWSGIHTTAYFMIVRGYEAKGYCSNVVIPMFLYGVLCLFRHWKPEGGSIADWRRLALVAWASVAVSMSAMALIPMGLAVMGMTMVLVSPGQWQQTLRHIIVCALPNICVVLLYLLHAKDVLVISVQ